MEERQTVSIQCIRDIRRGQWRHRGGARSLGWGDSHILLEEIVCGPKQRDEQKFTTQKYNASLP